MIDWVRDQRVGRDGFFGLGSIVIDRAGGHTWQG